jgi:hypothetical protein
METFANDFVPGAWRGTRQRRALQNFFIRLAHAISKPAISVPGKPRFSLKQGLPFIQQLIISALF